MKKSLLGMVLLISIFISQNSYGYNGNYLKQEWIITPDTQYVWKDITNWFFQWIPIENQLSGWYGDDDKYIIHQSPSPNNKLYFKSKTKSWEIVISWSSYTDVVWYWDNYNLILLSKNWYKNYWNLYYSIFLNDEFSTPIQVPRDITFFYDKEFLDINVYDLQSFNVSSYPINYWNGIKSWYWSKYYYWYIKDWKQKVSYWQSYQWWYWPIVVRESDNVPLYPKTVSGTTTFQQDLFGDWFSISWSPPSIWWYKKLWNTDRYIYYNSNLTVKMVIDQSSPNSVLNVSNFIYHSWLDIYYSVASWDYIYFKYNNHWFKKNYIQNEESELTYIQWKIKKDWILYSPLTSWINLPWFCSSWGGSNPVYSKVISNTDTKYSFLRLVWGSSTSVSWFENWISVWVINPWTPMKSDWISYYYFNQGWCNDYWYFDFDYSKFTSYNVSNFDSIPTIYWIYANSSPIVSPNGDVLNWDWTYILDQSNKNLQYSPFWTLNYLETFDLSLSFHSYIVPNSPYYNSSYLDWYKKKGIDISSVYWTWSNGKNYIDWNSPINLSKTDVQNWFLKGYYISARYPFTSYSWKDTESEFSNIYWRWNLQNTWFMSNTLWNNVWIKWYSIKNPSGEVLWYLEYPCWNLICKDIYCSNMWGTIPENMIWKECNPQTEEWLQHDQCQKCNNDWTIWYIESCTPTNTTSSCWNDIKEEWEQCDWVQTAFWYTCDNSCIKHLISNNQNENTTNTGGINTTELCNWNCSNSGVVFSWSVNERVIEIVSSCEIWNICWNICIENYCQPLTWNKTEITIPNNIQLPSTINISSNWISTITSIKNKKLIEIEYYVDWREIENVWEKIWILKMFYNESWLNGLWDYFGFNILK